MKKLFFIFFMMLYSNAHFATEPKFHNFNKGVEILIFKINPQKINEVMRIEHAITTNFLKKYPFFRAKQVGINPEKPGYIYILIEWDSYNKWKAISTKDIAEFTKYVDKNYLKETGTSLEFVETIGLKTMYIYSDYCHTSSGSKGT